MADCFAPARVVLRLEAGDAGFDFMDVGLINTLDTIKLTAFPSHAGKAINCITVT